MTPSLCAVKTLSGKNENSNTRILASLRKSKPQEMSDNPESSFVVNRRKVDINVVREVASNHTNDKKKENNNNNNNNQCRYIQVIQHLKLIMTSLIND